MIATSRLLEYPLVAISDGMQQRLGRALKSSGISANVIAYLNSYCHVAGIHLNESAFSTLDEIDDTLFGFEGYLLSNTKFKDKFVAKIHNQAKNILAATLGIKWTRDPYKIKHTLETRQQRSIKFYDFITKSESLLRYYSGWWFECREGKIKSVNLTRPYICYGEKITNQILDLIQSYCIRLSHNSIKTTLVHLKRILDLMCTLYPNQEELASLQVGKNVNEFVEILFANHKAHTISNNLNLKSFYSGWSLTIALFNEMLTETGLMSAPEWELLCPTYASASKHDIEEEQTIFEKAFIDVPLTFSDDDAFNAFESTVNEELGFVDKCCSAACLKEINDLHQTAQKAKLGKYIPNFTDLQLGNDFSEYDVCHTWQELTYNIRKSGLHKIIPAKKILDIVKPLRAHSLLPFLHVLVQQHPIITPPWLIEFELFDSSGQQVNYTQSGEDWIATSFKPRAKGHEQQSVVLTKTTKRIFDEIIALTKDAREYLRSTGDDSYRRLLLSGGRGLQKPAPIDIITPVGRMDSTVPLRAVMMSEVSETFPRERVERIVARLSLRTLRDAVAIQVYLQTMSMEAVALALGHAPGNAKSGEVYIPTVLRFYMMERWLRLFQNAIVYEAMKDSPYLLDAMDFNTIEELNEFLRAHKQNYKIVPDSETAIYQPASGLQENEYDRLYIELNLAKLEILLCIYEIINTALKNKTEVVAAAMQWYPIAKLMYQAVHLHREGELINYCSRSVLALFNQANPSKQLLEKIKDVVHA